MRCHEDCSLTGINAASWRGFISVSIAPSREYSQQPVIFNLTTNFPVRCGLFTRHVPLQWMNENPVAFLGSLAQDIRTLHKLIACNEDGN
jgi:hypothetical protein